MFDIDAYCGEYSEQWALDLLLAKLSGERHPIHSIGADLAKQRGLYDTACWYTHSPPILHSLDLPTHFDCTLHSLDLSTHLDCTWNPPPPQRAMTDA